MQDALSGMDRLVAIAAIERLKAQRDRAADIGKVLVDYNVPLIDDAGNVIPPAEALKGEVAPDASASSRRGRTAKATSSNFKMPGPAPAATPQDFKMPGPPPSGTPAAQP